MSTRRAGAMVLALALAACADADRQTSIGRTQAVCIGLCFTMTMTRQHEIRPVARDR